MTEPVRAESMLAVADVHGIHIPQIFVHRYMEHLNEEVKGLANYIRNNEDNDDEWEKLIQDATVTIEGKVYSIWQDGDVHLFPLAKNVKWVPDEDDLISDIDKRYSEWIDTTYGEVRVCGHEYQSSRVLKEVDETAYRCAFNDWIDAEVRDGVIFEYNDSYSYEDISEPNLVEFFMGDAENKGWYVWKEPERTTDYFKADWTIEFEKENP